MFSFDNCCYLLARFPNKTAPEPPAQANCVPSGVHEILNNDPVLGFSIA